MSRRSAVLSDKFLVHLNGEPLTKEEMEFQFRFPEKGGLGAAADVEESERSDGGWASPSC